MKGPARFCKRARARTANIPQDVEFVILFGHPAMPVIRRSASTEGIARLTEGRDEKHSCGSQPSAWKIERPSHCRFVPAPTASSKIIHAGPGKSAPVAHLLHQTGKESDGSHSASSNGGRCFGRDW
jgi:hypothetical protein